MFIMKWYFFAWYYFLLVNSTKTNNFPEVTLISQKIRKYRNIQHYNMSCVITNSTSAITWISDLTPNLKRVINPVSQFLPAVRTEYDCDISSGKESSCNEYWIHENKWSIQNSYFGDLPAVTDYRWEDFTVQVTNRYNKFIPIKPNVNSNTFKIHISIRTTKDAHIYMCESNDPSNSKCYWIVLNGWELRKDKRTILRKCAHEKVPKTDYPRNDCNTSQYSTYHTSKSYLSEDQWNHFTLEKTAYRIVLKALEDGRKLINYVYFDNDISVRSISIRTPGNTGYWKFHHYEYVYTKTKNMETYSALALNVQESQFCVSFFVAMCKNCNLNVAIVDYNSKKVISTTEISTKKPSRWKEEKIVMQLQQVPMTVTLRVYTWCSIDCQSPYWAIDRFRMCSTDEIRILTTVTATKFPCQIVTQPTKNVVLSDTSLMDITEPRCPLGTFGKECIPCSKVLGAANPYCANNVICGLTSEGVNLCHCVDGYQGNDCQTPCNDGFYGLNCRETCGNCLTFPCLAITGKCRATGCHKDFTGPFCKLIKYPYLLNPPKIVNVGHTYFIAEISNRTVVGAASSPLYIKIQYKQVAYETWFDTQPQLFDTAQSIRVDQLKVTTTYKVRFVLITAAGQFYNNSEIPEATVTTTCAFAKENEITKNIFNNSAIFILNKNSEESCNINGYLITINVGIVSAKSPVFSITNLEPFTTYNITFRRRNSNESLAIEFTTEEGVATQVEGLKVTGQTDTSISLQWSKPQRQNGIIRHYKIIYQHLKYRGCDNNIRVESREAPKDVTDKRTSTIIYNLLPYSEYSFRVIAVTIEEGAFSEIQGITLETETSEISEIPRISNVIPHSNWAQVILKKPDCTLIKGPIEYNLELFCSNEWCPKQKLNTTFPSSSSFLLLHNLEPYSNYSVKLTVIRKNGKILYNPGEYYKFKTQPDAPNPIKELTTYSKTNSKLYLRFAPPYPPNGELEQYEVYYCFSSAHYCYIYTKKSFLPQVCTIWANLHCITLEKLAGNIKYTVEIRAKNKNVDKLSSEVFTFGYTQENKSDPSQNISLLWNDNNTLHLTWNHPNITNGPLTRFHIQMNISNTDKRCFEYDYLIKEERNNYTLDLNIIFMLPECHSSRIIVLIFPFNTELGNFGEIDVDSPPPTPGFLKTPFIQSTSNYTITLSIPKPQNVSSISFLYIFVTSIESSRTIDNIEELLKRKENLDSISELVAKFNLSLTTPQELIIGGNETKSSSELKAEVLKRIELIPETNYHIKILLINTYSNFTRYQVYTVSAKTTEKKTISEEPLDIPNYDLLSLLLLLLLPIIFWVYIRKHKEAIPLWLTATLSNMNTTTTSNPDVIPLSRNVEYPTPREHPAKPQIPLKKLKPKILEPKGRQSHNTHISKFSRPIHIKDFENYVKESIAKEELERQHQLFPRGQTKPWEYAALPQNKSKNRYKNLIAYDHTRVKLEKINNDPYSDYINANYIDGYKTRNAYIATQGPKVATVNDFWRMIWQENVSYIVMLANVTESGKKKTEQYWPNINQSTHYGTIRVEFVSTQVYADYHNRTFLVSNECVERMIEQLHFISWPDHGVPLYTQSLVPFLRRLINIPHGKSPVVVHCSAGVGRTGTIILCDLCLRMALREECIDVLKFQHKLREQRANLVDNIDQYKLVHLAIIEYLINPTTVLNFDENVERSILRVLESEEQENQLRNITARYWQDQALRSIIPFKPNSAWRPKNRFQNIIHGGYGRVYLSRYPTTDEHSDYINAIEVDGFKAPEKFIVTQQPLPSTIPDFWRMIDEKEVSTIISLNKIDRTNIDSCIFCPTAKISEIQPVPYLTVEFLEKSNNEFFNISTLIMQNKKDKKRSKRTVHFITLNCWSAEQLVPDSIESLLKLWEETERITTGEAPIVVTCYNGAQASGLFVALTFVVDKIKLEQECDVCLAVRTVRLNRMQFVENVEQFTFLYKAAMKYIEGFELYANFAPINKN